MRVIIIKSYILFISRPGEVVSELARESVVAGPRGLAPVLRRVVVLLPEGPHQGAFVSGVKVPAVGIDVAQGLVAARPGHVAQLVLEPHRGLGVEGRDAAALVLREEVVARLVDPERGWV